MFYPPLVPAVGQVDAAERRRTARQTRLPQLGPVGQARLAAAKVLVMGAGGIGTPVLQYLAAAGVGTLAIVDDDRVEESNLHRQVLFAADDVGTPKTTAAAHRLRQLGPSSIIEIPHRLDARNARDILSPYHLVIDGTDTFTTRTAVADAAEALGMPLVWGSVLRFDAQATVFWSRPPHGPAVRLRDVFPDPPPHLPSCAEAGVVGAVCGQVGALLAMEAIKLICGIGEPLIGRMAVIDALTGLSREVPLVSLPPRQRVPVISREEALTAGLRLVDVRSEQEHCLGALPGSVHVPLDAVLADPAAALALLGPADAGVALYCESGPRARAAAHALIAADAPWPVWVLSGGFADYREDMTHPATAEPQGDAP